MINSARRVVAALAAHRRAVRQLEQANRRAAVEWTGCSGVCLLRPTCRQHQTCDSSAWPPAER